MGKFTVTHDTSIGVLLSQILEQGEHRSLLGFSTGIGRSAFLVQTALVTDAEGTTVVVTGMSTTDILRKNGDDGPVATDVIMIGGLAEAGFASRYQRFGAEGTVAARGTAVNDQQLDGVVLKFFHHTNGLGIHAALHEEG